MKNSPNSQHRNTIFPTILFLLSLSVATNQSTAAAAKPGISKPSCRIEVDDAHISSSIRKHLKISVLKVNARSICNVRQDHVTLTLIIYKIGYLSNHLMHRVETNPLIPSSSGLIVKVQDAKVACKNGQLSSYYGMAYAKAFIQGKWQYAGKTRSANIRSLRCGT
ncbi:MAG: hypothetical protein D4R83_06365 [Streptomycetaceae bacterium]|nr:MAG: hypothetical protein D4R83_06365 [Streptomycetaceae bacterium]